MLIRGKLNSYTVRSNKMWNECGLRSSVYSRNIAWDNAIYKSIAPIYNKAINRQQEIHGFSGSYCYTIIDIHRQISK